MDFVSNKQNLLTKEADDIITAGAYWEYWAQKTSGSASLGTILNRNLPCSDSLPLVLSSGLLWC